MEEIYHAKQLVNFRHPNYFYGIPAIVPGRRCTCKKSQCRKKYCECYNAGLKCTEDCECCDCHNGKPDMDHYFERSRMEIEVHAWFFLYFNVIFISFLSYLCAIFYDWIPVHSLSGLRKDYGKGSSADYNRNRTENEFQLFFPTFEFLLIFIFLSNQ